MAKTNNEQAASQCRCGGAAGVIINVNDTASGGSYAFGCSEGCCQTDWKATIEEALEAWNQMQAKSKRRKSA